MRRIDTATKAVDLFGAGKHGFKNGDPALAILATKLNAEFFNSIQEELSRAIEGAGLTLAPADNTQLLAAIIALARGILPKRSFAANDFIRIPDVPGGLIIQVGMVASIAAGGSVTVTRPVAFPAAAYLSIPNNAYAGDSGSVIAVTGCSGISLAQFAIRNHGASVQTNVQWLSVGY